MHHLLVCVEDFQAGNSNFCPCSTLHWLSKSLKTLIEEMDSLGKVDIEEVGIKSRLNNTSNHSDDVNTFVYVPPIMIDGEISQNRRDLKNNYCRTHLYIQFGM